MLNTHKLFYILPDVAYIAELLPAKKANTFSIQSFRQINGEFMDDETFISKNIQKLFNKLEEGEYHLVLPDFLFTNTILSVSETSETKVKKHVKEILLPELNLTDETHELQTFTLTEFKGVSKVQLSAIEKSLLAPIRVASHQNKVKILGLSPLSWTIKSEVSLEPSISVLQIGSQLYTALQYIGVDQATISPVSDTEITAETIKTLKGAEANIQTVYLLTNSKVEEELKELVSKTLPLQQLASAKDEDSKMPSYVQQIIESGMRTLSIDDYPVPKFELGKATKEEIGELAVSIVEDIDDDEDLAGETDDKKEGDESDPELDAEDSLPTPSLPSIPTVGPDGVVKDTDEDDSETTDLDSDLPKDLEDISDDSESDSPSDKEVNMPKDEDKKEVETAEEEKEKAETDDSEIKKDDEKPESESESSETSENKEKDQEENKPASTQKDSSDSDDNDDSNGDNDIDLSQFASHASAGVSSSSDSPKLDSDESAEKPAIEFETATKDSKKEVIKNSSGVGRMLKMVFITILVFAITVAIGVGAGFGLLSMGSKNKAVPTPTASPAVVDKTTPKPTSSPTTDTDSSASPSASVKQEEVSVLIVNATTKAGYAGTFKASLDKAGYSQVTAANAKGEYEEGFYVLMPEKNPELVEQLGKDADLKLEFAEGYATEDTAKQYDAVIVLAK